MKKELIERLRNRAKITDHSTGDPLCAEAADALEGGVTVTDATEETVARVLVHEARGKFGFETAYRYAAKILAALSTPAQRVEVEPELEIGDGILTWRSEGYSINVAADEATLNIFGVGARRIAVGDELLDAVHAASPAPAPHAGVEITEGMVTVARAELLGGSSRENVRRALRAALGART